jgi:hypothetical protein
MLASRGLLKPLEGREMADMLTATRTLASPKDIKT